MQITHNTKRLQSYPVVLLLCIALFLMGFHVHICNATSVCNAANYTNAKATKFHSNLNIVLNNLVNQINSSLNGYTTSVSGQRPDTVYGFLQCRGDATVDECYSCSLEANSSARKDCGNAIGGRIWPQKCFLRYENYSFVGELDKNVTDIYPSQGFSTDPDVFATAVEAFFTNLTTEAYGSANLYSSGTTFDSSHQQIYGLVQCWRDLTSIDDCRSCLTTAVNILLEATMQVGGVRLGGAVGLGSCMARYDIYPFFTSARPLPRPTPTPPPKKSSNKLAIVLGILGGSLVVLLLFMFAIRRKLKSAISGKSLVLEKDILVDYNHNKLDGSLLWTLSVDVGNGYQCRRPVNNTHLNLNAKEANGKDGGICDGNELILISWKK